MGRNALRRILEGLVVAALPLAQGGCSTCGPYAENYEMAIVGGEEPVGAGYLSEEVCTRLCGWDDADAAIPTSYGSYRRRGGIATNLVHQCRVIRSATGAPVAFCQDFVYPDCTGRRPAGLRRGVARARLLGEALARLAHLEAASVPAFRRLAGELRRHGAPPSLVVRAQAAAREEVGHARTLGRLARRHGGTVPPVLVDPVGTRGLEAVALENAVEGCVRETLGAALGLWQARTAGDPGFRAAMAGIALEEVGHAQLAADVDGWARSRLERAARARVGEARRAAAEALVVAAATPTGAALAAALGLPPPAAARVLAEGVRALAI